MVAPSKHATVFDAVVCDGDDEAFEPWRHFVQEGFLPTDAPAGSQEKIDQLRRRVLKGFPLWHQDDRVDYSGLTGALRPSEFDSSDRSEARDSSVLAASSRQELLSRSSTVSDSIGLVPSLDLPFFSTAADVHPSGMNREPQQLESGSGHVERHEALTKANGKSSSASQDNPTFDGEAANNSSQGILAVSGAFASALPGSVDSHELSAREDSRLGEMRSSARELGAESHVTQERQASTEAISRASRVRSHSRKGRSTSAISVIREAYAKSESSKVTSPPAVETEWIPQGEQAIIAERTITPDVKQPGPLVRQPRVEQVLRLLHSLEEAVRANTIYPQALEQFKREHAAILAEHANMQSCRTVA